MSLTTPFTAVCITPLANGQIDLIDSQPQEAESGWDTLRLSYLIRLDSAGTDPHLVLSSLLIPARGAQVSGKNVWIVDRTAKCLAPGLFRADLTARGLLTARGYKVTYDSAGAGQTAQDITITGVGSFAKVATREAAVTATFEYVLIGSGYPADTYFLTSQTGRAKEPPPGWKPTVPSSVWGYLTDFTYNYPNGWIFDGATMENLPGVATVYLVKEKYTYQQERNP